jgi:hypothetical protein
MIEEVHAVLGVDDRDHPAAGMFDTREFVDGACAAFGRLPETDGTLTWIAISGPDGSPAGVSLHQWTGRTSALVQASGPFDWLRPTIESLLPLVTARNLMLYDPQARSVYNNRRHYPDLDG